MKILFSPFSPYVRKCLIAAHELGIHEQLSLLPSNAHPVNRDPSIIQDNPLGKIPTFFSDDGLVLFDSRVICEYLNDTYGGLLFPASGAARWRVLTLQSLGDGMLDALLLARYEDVARPETFRWDDWRLAQLDKVETSLRYLEGQPALFEASVDIGQIAVGCALWYLGVRFPAFDWCDRFPVLAAWYLAFSARPSQQYHWPQP